MQSTFQYLAAKKFKQIMTTNTHNTIHKRCQHNLNQIKKILQQNNITIAKADKSKAMVIINKDALKGAFIVYFNVNFNILKQINCALVGVVKDWKTLERTVQL
jgi:hypothetical protein